MSEAPELTGSEAEQIHALANVIVAKVLDEVAPNSEDVSTSRLALGALACTAARFQLERAALHPDEFERA